jgi:uncharacterized Zn finger protein
MVKGANLKRGINMSNLSISGVNLVHKVCEKCQGEAHEVIVITDKNHTHRCLACGYESVVPQEPKKPFTQQPVITLKK